MCIWWTEQENSTLQRLTNEKTVLEGSVGYLRARLAVESALSPDPSSSSSSESGSGSESEPPSSSPQPGPD